MSGVARIASNVTISITGSTRLCAADGLPRPAMLDPLAPATRQPRARPGGPWFAGSSPATKKNRAAAFVRRTSALLGIDLLVLADDVVFRLVVDDLALRNIHVHRAVHVA